MNSFVKELNKIMSLGYTELEAGCYLCNFHDDYICKKYNNGCKYTNTCKEIKEKLKETTNV